MKKLLILAGAAVHCKVVMAAKEMGVYTIVTDNVVDSPAKKIADESLMYDIYDVDGIVGYCRKNHIDGVLNFCIDPAQRPAQQIAERLGLPSFGTAEQVFSLTDKDAFKKLCKESGVDVIPEYSEKDIDNDIIEYPVFVKPVDSRGSRGQSVCWSAEELKNGLFTAKKESSNGKVIIEKYMGENQDFSASYLFVNGEGYLVKTSDRHLGNKKDGLDRQCICGIAPSGSTKMFVENVNDRIIRMIKKLGIKTAPVFMQGFVDGDTVRVYDPGIRFQGSEYEILFEKVTGINLMKLMIEYALGGTPKIQWGGGI